MLDNRNSHLYPVWEDYIASKDVVAAFRYIVGRAACDCRFTCGIYEKGKVKDFRIFDLSGDSQLYSFITNKEWLLFYFRKPSRRLFSDRGKVSGAFDTFNEPNEGEWTVRLFNIGDVDRVWELLGDGNTV